MALVVYMALVYMVIKLQWSKLKFEISKIKDESHTQDYCDDNDFDSAQIKDYIRRSIHYNKKEEKSEFVESIQ